MAVTNCGERREGEEGREHPYPRWRRRKHALRGGRHTFLPRPPCGHRVHPGRGRATSSGLGRKQLFSRRPSGGLGEIGRRQLGCRRHMGLVMYWLRLPTASHHKQHSSSRWIYEEGSCTFMTCNLGKSICMSHPCGCRLALVLSRRLIHARRACCIGLVFNGHNESNMVRMGSYTQHTSKQPLRQSTP